LPDHVQRQVRLSIATKPTLNDIGGWAKIANNQIEAMLKIVVRDRKNAMFHKTLLGATIGDVVTSLIATASESGINVFNYFTTLQQEREKVKSNPEKYLPWNYLDDHE